MLTKCPECNLQVSDKALTCPHCGYPLRGHVKQRKTRRKRLPNGFGAISEIKGRNLRLPYRARVCTGKTSTGTPIRKNIGYFKTYNDAYAALVKYNLNPYDLDHDIRLYELYEQWSEEYFKKISASAQRTVISAWKHSQQIKDMRVVDIRARHIKAVMDNAPSENIKGRIKSIFNLMLDYAMEYEIVQVNYARTFDKDDVVVDDSKAMHYAHMIYTPEEISILWDNVADPIAADVLIQCYTGWRPQELCLLETKNISLNDWTMTGGMKTASGKGRVVPIHDKIKPLVMQKYQASSEWFLLDENGKHMTYDKLRHRFDAFKERTGLNINHRLHDGRKTFVTMAKNVGMDEYAIKKIVGHKISDITEAVYTERPAGWLAEEMKKI